jgi:hypothetical protein
MRVMRLMEDLLAIEAETKFLLTAKDRSHEQTLMQELLKIIKEAERLFGPRDASYQLSVPRITDCASSRTYILPPLRVTRIYLSRNAKTKPWVASLESARSNLLLWRFPVFHSSIKASKSDHSGSVSTATGSDLVSDQHAIFPNDS